MESAHQGGATAPSDARLQEALADRYRIEGQLGRGGMATVYLAHDLKHQRRVALKVLHPDPAAPLAPERFQREIRLVARLQHPHILTVHDSGAAAGSLWFTMPYCGWGVSAAAACPRAAAPDRRRGGDAQEVARALDYAHRQGVVHRDIKPENILLSREADALVADFGIGRALAGETEPSAGAVGTPARPGGRAAGGA